MKTVSINHRIEWVDIARGIAIILMVAGHSTIPTSLSKYIWSFHMPLFFLVSGMFFNPVKYNSFKELLIKRVRTLVIPYWVFSIVVAFGYIGTEYDKPYQLYYGWEGYALWFVPVLFFAELLFFPITKLSTRKQMIVILLLTIVGRVLSHFDVTLPFKIEVVPFALFFIGAGYIGKHFLLKDKPRVWIVILAGIVTITLSQVLPKLGMGRNEYGLMLPNLSNALLGIYFVFCVSKYLEKWLRFVPIKVLAYFGRNSLFVMAFSQVFNYWILTGLTALGLCGALGLATRYIILFTAIYAVATLMTMYVPFLVGKEYNKQPRHE